MTSSARLGNLRQQTSDWNKEMFARKNVRMSRAMLALALAAVAALPAVAAPPGTAEDALQGADCFFAENRDDPLCRETVVAAAAPLQRPVAPPQYVPNRDDDEGVDCFFAESRDHPLCRVTP
jgi:hypothetical protein